MVTYNNVFNNIGLYPSKSYLFLLTYIYNKYNYHENGLSRDMVNNKW